MTIAAPSKAVAQELEEFLLGQLGDAKAVSRNDEVLFTYVDSRDRAQIVADAVARAGNEAAGLAVAVHRWDDAASDWIDLEGTPENGPQKEGKGRIEGIFAVLVDGFPL